MPPEPPRPAPAPAPGGALERLFARQRFGVAPGLERVRALLDDVGRPQDAYRAALVAGTNGKGSAAAVLAACLGAAGFRTGRTTSPHLTRVGERVAVDGSETPRAAMEALAEELLPRVEARGATFFEAVTALALLRFAREGVERAVVEIGLGGRWDAGNALEPDLSIVTGVALDHQAVLGGTVEEIAREKAGVMRAGRPTLTGATGGALAALREEAASTGAELVVLGEHLEARGRTLGWDGIALELTADGRRLELRSPLLGAHQVRNVALAAAAALRWGAAPEAVREGAARARWPGRLEPFDLGGRRVLLDGAHNAEAAAALAAALRDLGIAGGIAGGTAGSAAEPARRPGRTVLLIGASADKDLAAIAAALDPVVDEVVATRARWSPRARDPRELRSAFGRGRVESDPAAALSAALERAGEGGAVVAAGSLYLIGELRPLLTGEAEEGLERWQ